MNKTLIVALLAVTLATPFVLAEPVGRCGSDGEVALGIMQFDTPAGTFYVDDRNYLLGNGIWIYQESNDLSGLQRGGASAIVPDDPEICVDDESTNGPDQLIL